MLFCYAGCYAKVVAIGAEINYGRRAMFTVSGSIDPGRVMLVPMLEHPAHGRQCQQIRIALAHPQE